MPLLFRLLAFAVLISASIAQAPLDCVPAPKELDLRPGTIVCSDLAKIVVSDDSLLPLAQVLKEEWRQLIGGELKIVRAAPPDEPVIVLDLSLGSGSRPRSEIEEDESYQLEIGGRVTIRAASYQGVAHGTTTLLQAARHNDAVWHLPKLKIDDGPAAPYRGLMIDVARREHSLDTLLAIVRLARFYKVRYLHLHLTDDQHFTFPFSPIIDNLTRPNHSLPLEAWKKLVAYADARGVTIIPELDIPGHSRRIIESGYLPGAENHADVADPKNLPKLLDLIDAMCEVFESSPYFHIGGDESGAGEKLVPMIAGINKHLRKHKKYQGRRKRLMVWEGFHGAPKSIPARGADRVVVMSWESSYNPPWNLLDAGYEVINASWKPLYVVGGGAYRYPHVAQRKWSPVELCSWDKNQFWHWEPGRPVFEDRGPGDKTDDGKWTAPAARREQILGAQLIFWEQTEHSVIPDARLRLPVVSQKLWDSREVDPEESLAMIRRIDDRAMALVSPLEILPAPDTNRSAAEVDAIPLSMVKGGIVLKNRSALSGEIRYTLDGSEPTFTSPLYEEPIKSEKSMTLKARLFVEGRAWPGTSVQKFSAEPYRVWSRIYEVPRRGLDEVPDFLEPTWAPHAISKIPDIRGPYTMDRRQGQMLTATLVVDEKMAGEITLRLKTRTGRACLYFEGKKVLGPTTPDEKPLVVVRKLEAGRYKLRICHLTGAISPTLMMAIKRPGGQRFEDIKPFLQALR